jgi:hypothetical protein
MPLPRRKIFPLVRLFRRSSEFCKCLFLMRVEALSAAAAKGVEQCQDEQKQPVQLTLHLGRIEYPPNGFCGSPTQRMQHFVTLAKFGKFPRASSLLSHSLLFRLYFSSSPPVRIRVGLSLLLQVAVAEKVTVMLILGRPRF